jgi:hypothetical protein
MVAKLELCRVFFILSQIIQDMENKKKYSYKKNNVTTYRKKKDGSIHKYLMYNK